MRYLLRLFKKWRLVTRCKLSRRFSARRIYKNLKLIKSCDNIIAKTEKRLEKYYKDIKFYDYAIKFFNEIEVKK